MKNQKTILTTLLAISLILSVTGRPHWLIPALIAAAGLSLLALKERKQGET